MKFRIDEEYVFDCSDEITAKSHLPKREYSIHLSAYSFEYIGKSIKKIEIDRFRNNLHS